MAEKSPANELMTHCSSLDFRNGEVGRERGSALQTRGSLKTKDSGSFKMYVGLEDKEISLSQSSPSRTLEN